MTKILVAASFFASLVCPASQIPDYYINNLSGLTCQGDDFTVAVKIGSGKEWVESVEFCVLDQRSNAKHTVQTSAFIKYIPTSFAPAVFKLAVCYRMQDARTAATFCETIDGRGYLFYGPLMRYQSKACTITRDKPDQAVFFKTVFPCTEQDFTATRGGLCARRREE